MDPLSQGSVGAALAGSSARPEQLKSALLLGCLGGLAPDLDILITSTTDPLLFLEYHRQFTHALVFVPVGALVVALATYRWLGKHLTFGQAYSFCLLGYATHGLLDACTTYGTQLLWPFSDMRVAWNNVSIIDPVFTLPIVGLIAYGAVRRRPAFARYALIWGLAYLLLGVVQRERAEAAAWSIAEARGHEPIRLEAKPGFANLLLWKVVYETESRFHVDAVRIGTQTRAYEGAAAAKLDVSRDLPWLAPDSQQARDVERFRWFSNGYLAMDPHQPNRVIDVRYSVVPNEIDPLWAIELAPDAGSEQHVRWLSIRRTDAEQTAKLWRMLTECCGWWGESDER